MPLLRNCTFQVLHLSWCRCLCHPWMVIDRIIEHSISHRLPTCLCNTILRRSSQFRALWNKCNSKLNRTDSNRFMPQLTNEFGRAKQNLKLLVRIVASCHSKVNNLNAISFSRQTQYIFWFENEIESKQFVCVCFAFGFTNLVWDPNVEYHDCVKNRHLHKSVE